MMKSFDVTSLYTNVSNDCAFQAALELPNDHHSAINMHSFTVPQVVTLVKECLSCTVLGVQGNTASRFEV